MTALYFLQHWTKTSWSGLLLILQSTVAIWAAIINFKLNKQSCIERVTKSQTAKKVTMNDSEAFLRNQRTKKA